MSWLGTHFDVSAIVLRTPISSASLHFGLPSRKWCLFCKNHGCSVAAMLLMNWFILLAKFYFHEKQFKTLFLKRKTSHSIIFKRVNRKPKFLFKRKRSPPTFFTVHWIDCDPAVHCGRSEWKPKRSTPEVFCHRNPSVGIE